MEGISYKFGFEIILTKKGFRVNGRFKVIFSDCIPNRLRTEIDHDVAIAPFLVEGPRLSVSDLKKIGMKNPHDSLLSNLISRLKVMGVPVES